jgi:hypothetical protein
MTEVENRVCPGCGGRNHPHADACDWCGRSFSGQRRSISVRWWPLATSILFGLVVLAVVSLAILNANRPDVRPRPSPTADAKATPLLAQAGVPTAAAPTPRPPPATARPVPPAPPTPTPTPRYVRVFNTGGLGVNIRREPGPQAQPVFAVADNSILKLVGPEETVQARLWRLCEHEARGIQGWVPADFLQPTDQMPTPGRG